MYDLTQDTPTRLFVFHRTIVVYIFRIGERQCDIFVARARLAFCSIDGDLSSRAERRNLCRGNSTAICTILTETVVAAGRQVFRRVSVMRTASPFTGPERLDFRSQGQTPPKELLIGNATVLVRAQFPHQFLHRILEVQFPAHRQ